MASKTVSHSQVHKHAARLALASDISTFHLLPHSCLQTLVSSSIVLFTASYVRPLKNAACSVSVLLKGLMRNPSEAQGDHFLERADQALQLSSLLFVVCADGRLWLFPPMFSSVGLCVLCRRALPVEVCVPGMAGES